MKSPGSEPVSFTLGRKLGKWLKSQPDLPCYDRIVSTPKHWWKRFSRHHNSAEFLAEQIGSVLRVPVDHRLLIRTRATAKQGTLMKQARKENVLGAFAVRSPHRVRGRAILLVDDIVTSGATAGEMAKVLLKSGAARVDVACLARGIGK
jgi:ComF family protein